MSTLDIEPQLDIDGLGREIGNRWTTWDAARGVWAKNYQEVQQYLYATRTNDIIGQPSQEWYSNNHIPKLTQLRDLLITYYSESLFSLNDYIEWEGSTKDSNTQAQRNMIQAFIKGMLDKGGYRETVEQLLEDYVDCGNAFAMPEWVVDMVSTPDGLKERFKGVKIRRINPMDIVFDPLAVDFKNTPKIIRAVKSLGELKQLSEVDETMKKAFNRVIENRNKIRAVYANGDTIKNDSLNLGGFGDMLTYANADTCELLTFIGDLYDSTSNTIKHNAKIVVLDRTVVLSDETFSDTDSLNLIFQARWRNRKDSLWGMSPLENLIGMQYRIDYLENKRADVYDFVSNPVLLCLGEVEVPDKLAPGTRISGDATATVRYLSPDVSVLQASTLMAEYMSLMEEFAGAPREVMGFRTPGEKTAFEYNQILNAAQRIFQRKTRVFELMTEDLINAALSMYISRARGQKIVLKVWDDDKGYEKFKEVAVDSLKTEGRIKAVGSTSYADKGRLAQTLQQLGNSGLFMDQSVLANISPTKLAETMIYATGLDKIQGLFRKDSRLYEMAEQSTLAARLQQDAQNELARPTMEETAQALTMMEAQQ